MNITERLAWSACLVAILVWAYLGLLPIWREWMVSRSQPPCRSRLSAEDQAWVERLHKEWKTRSVGKGRERVGNDRGNS
jgi:hypothetical protein